MLEISLTEVVLCIIVFCPVLFSSRGWRTQALSPEYKLTKLILWFRCPSYILTSWRKSAHIYKPSGQIYKAFNQHGTTGKTKYLGNKYFNLPKWLILFQDALTIFFFYLSFPSRTFTIHSTARKGRSFLFDSFPPFPPASQKLRH